MVNKEECKKNKAHWPIGLELVKSNLRHWLRRMNEPIAAHAHTRRFSVFVVTIVIAPTIVVVVVRAIVERSPAAPNAAAEAAFTSRRAAAVGRARSDREWEYLVCHFQHWDEF